jgi:hypothetical protein
MTDENHHQEVRIEIAGWLAANVHPSFVFYTKLFAVMNDCIKERFVPHEFLNVECATTDAMLEELYNEYGSKQLVKQINKCL